MAPAERVRERVCHYAQRMTRHEFFSHATAAILWRLPIPSGFLVPDEIDVGVFSPRRSSEGAGVRGHAVHPRLARVVTHPHLGVRVASPASTWAMLGSVITSHVDLIAVGDAVVREPRHPNDPPQLATFEQLAAAIGAGRRQGIGALREALPYVRSGSDSHPETCTRLALVDAGLPEPLLGFEVWAEGVWLGRVDMAYPEVKVAIEYEGEQHLFDAKQWAADIRRYDRLAEAGWRVIRVTKRDLFDDPAALVARVGRALARG